jgi:hypothetical protein
MLKRCALMVSSSRSRSINGVGSDTTVDGSVPWVGNPAYASPGEPARATWSSPFLKCLPR